MKNNFSQLLNLYFHFRNNKNKKGFVDNYYYDMSNFYVKEKFIELIWFYLN